MGFPDSRTIPCTAFFELEKSIPKTQMISQWQDTWNRFSFSDSQKCTDKWHNLRSNYTKESRKSKENCEEVGLRWKGNGYIMMSRNFWSTTCGVEQRKCSRDSNCNWSCIHWCRNWNGQFWTTGRIKYNSRPENGRRSCKKEQPAGIKRGGKIQKLTAVDIGKQYLDFLKEIGKELRSWVRISITILNE